MKKAFSLFLALAMVVIMMSIVSIPTFAAKDEVQYLSPIYVDSKDATKGISGWETKTVTEYHEVTFSDLSWGDGWYVVKGDVDINHSVTCEGHVNLILTDGCKLTVSDSDTDKSAVNVTDENRLTVYCQKNGTGKLVAKSGENAAGIGGNNGQSGENITIYGGDITAQGGDNGAGIGGGNSGFGRYIYIYGGTVNATGGNKGSGIGGGTDSIAEHIIITGGNVTATGGRYGAGIGGGYSNDNKKTVSNITISGGVLNASSPIFVDDYYGAAGIGGGFNEHASYITISGGEVTATAGRFSAGIGGGCNGDGSYITITGGTVISTGGRCGAGIGSGYDGSAYYITISGGNVTAVSDLNGAGIGGGCCSEYDPNKGVYNITISGGVINASCNYEEDNQQGQPGGAGIGGGYSQKVKGISISGGDITATGGPYSPGIGCGSCSIIEDLEISGGTVRANGGYNGPGIGSGSTSTLYSIRITGGEIYAKGNSASIGVGAKDKTNYYSMIENFYLASNMTATSKDGKSTITGKGLKEKMDMPLSNHESDAYNKNFFVKNKEITITVTGSDMASVFSNTQIWFVFGGVVILAALAAAVVVKKKQTNVNV